MDTIRKIKMFAWKLAWGRLPTSTNLARFSNIPSCKCYVCNEGEDSADHIFFKCPFAMQLWSCVERYLGLGFKFKDLWPVGGWLKEGLPFDKRSGSKITGLIAACLWHLWKNRNNICFNKKSNGIFTFLFRALAEVYKDLPLNLD
ncbi:RNA-directed DNA polymerase, eukaryota [Canna indica]|uniref:RNA-directed DNA polymerase, eukaryota n=1 Tax=Canna indica TaxID=4628 RepID=A0AAQ3QPA7_9LILI|nr:RNA-directed DNA polymerase, eukaryota [Canna indica]